MSSKTQVTAVGSARESLGTHERCDLSGGEAKLFRHAFLPVRKALVQ